VGGVVAVVVVGVGSKIHFNHFCDTILKGSGDGV